MRIEIVVRDQDWNFTFTIFFKHLDEKVARLHLAKIGVELDELSTEQAAYLGIPQFGPFKNDAYRY